MLKKDDVDRARRLAGLIEEWAKLCVVFVTGVSASPDETPGRAILREFYLMTKVFFGLTTLPQMLTIMLDEHKYDHDIVFNGILEEAVKDYRTIDQTSLALKLKDTVERIGKWIADKAKEDQ